MTLFLAYASMFPEMEVYLYMILPIKVKWLGYLDGLGIGTIVAAFTMGKMVAITGNWIDQRITFVSVLSKQQI